MRHKNAFIIDEDREFAKRVAAALRNDALRVGIAEGDRDPVEEVMGDQPDIVLMRADGREGESGFALCSRFKKRLSDLPVFLYSCEADAQTFEHHQQQEGAADAYIRFPKEPPYPMDDLRAQVDGVLFIGATDDINAEEGDAGRGEDGPPPLPGVEEAPAVKPISEEETAFLDRVLDSLKDVNVEEEASTIPPLRSASATRRTTADAKLDMLRQKLRQRELELAKVMEMFRAKEREYHEWNERLVEKDVEAQALKVTIEDHERAFQQAQTELERRTSEFNASFQQLLQDKESREDELGQSIAEKEARLEQTQAALEAARAEIERLTTELAELKAETERADQAQREAMAALRRELEDREGTLASVEQDLADTQDRVEELQARTADQTEALGSQERSVTELQGQVLTLRSDLADTREALDTAVNQHRDELRASDQIIDGLRHDFDQAQATHGQRQAELAQTVDALTLQLEARHERLRALTVAQRDLDAAYKGLQLEGPAREASQARRIAILTDSLEAERANRAQAEAQFDAELEQARRKVSTLQDSIADLDVVSGERLRVLAEQVEERDALITGLRDSITDLEARRQGLQNEVDQRLAELAETESTHAEAASTWGAERTRLQGDLSAAQSQLRAGEDEIASLNAEVGDLQAHLEDLELARATAEAEFRAQLESQARSLASTREAAQAQEAQLTAKLGDAADGAKALEDELAQAHQQLAQEQDSVHGLRETIAARDGRIVELQEGLRKASEAHDLTTAELTELRVEHDARNERIGRLEGQLQAQGQAVEALKIENAQLHVDRDSAREALTQLRADLAVSHTSVEERSNQLQESTRRLHDREGEVTGLRGQILELTGLRDRAIESKDQLQRQLDDARRDWAVARDELMAERQELTERLRVLEVEHETLRRARDGLSQDVALHSQQEEGLHAQLREATRDLEGERARREAAVREIERLSANISALSADKDGLTERFGSEADTMTRRLQEAMSQSATLASEKAALEEELREARRDREDTENKYVRELEEVHDDYMRKAQEAGAEHAREVETLRKAALDAKRQLKTAQLATHRLEERVRRLESDRPASSDASADFESFIAQFSDGSSPPRAGGSRRSRPAEAGSTPPIPALAPARPERVPPVADALASPAVVSSVADRDEDEVTDVGANPLPITSPSHVSTTARSTLPAPTSFGRKLQSGAAEEPDDFLAAFDKEFEDIKGG